MSPDFRLSVSAVPDPLPVDVDETFYWSRKGTMPYFSSNVGPSLGDFGAVNSRNIDFVRIASAVLSADRSSPRSGRLSRWNQREISVTVEVLAANPWNGVRTELENLLGFLTGDIWHLTFMRGKSGAEQIGSRAIGAKRVVLLSGGADSATGALWSALELKGSGKQHALLSHWAASNLSPLQRELAAEVERIAPGTLSDHVQIHHSRGRRTASGRRYKKEDSTRSRSIVFIAFGLALASVEGVPLWIPENGYASINPPLASNRRGSLSTKTTHPAFLSGLQDILAKVGAHHDLFNPFADLTKGEMFLKVKGSLGVDSASKFLSATVSCSHTGARSYGISPSVACGVCFGCILRKASFVASGIPDQTRYLDAGDDVRIQEWLDGKSVIPAMHDFLESPFDENDLATLRIPDSLALADVANLCHRARNELRGLGL